MKGSSARERLLESVLRATLDPIYMFDAEGRCISHSLSPDVDWASGLLLRWADQELVDGHAAGPGDDV